MFILLNKVLLLYFDSLLVVTDMSTRLLNLTFMNGQE